MSTSTAKEQTPKPTPAQNEAEGVESLRVVWRGHELDVPPSVDDWPLDAQYAFETGKAAVGIRHLLGAKQFAQLLGAGYTNKDLGELTDTIMTELGLGGDAGE